MDAEQLLSGCGVRDDADLHPRGDSQLRRQRQHVLPDAHLEQAVVAGRGRALRQGGPERHLDLERHRPASSASRRR